MIKNIEDLKTSSLLELIQPKPNNLFYKHEYSNGNGTAQIKHLFWDKKLFNPKPLYLIKGFICIGGTWNCLVSDIFADSGITAHFVINPNWGSRGSRRYFLVEM